MNYPILKFFKYDHLPKHLQSASAPFQVVADLFVERHGEQGKTPVSALSLLMAHCASLPDCGERRMCLIKLQLLYRPITLAASLRLLLEAKDCAVRAELERGSD